METYISILRGINVGGKRMIKMEALREMFTGGLKFENVRSYIQSGNVLFQSKKSDPQKLAVLIEKTILKSFGFEVPVLVLMMDEMKRVVSNNPFLQDETRHAAHFHVTFLSAAPLSENVEKIKPETFAPDAFRVMDEAVYLYCPNKYSNSKLTNGFLENKLKVTATTRNWKTVLELVEMGAREEA